MKNQFNELIDILKYHRNKYPKITPIDIIKLIYQNEMGGGHLITNKEKCLEYIKYEYDNISHQKEDLYTEIGNDIVRVSLHVYKDDLNKLSDLFILSSQMIKGNINILKEKLEYVKTWINDNNIFDFNKDEFNEELEKYYKNGMPSVSHSSIYKKNYNPAYRIIFKKLL